MHRGDYVIAVAFNSYGTLLAAGTTNGETRNPPFGR